MDQFEPTSQDAMRLARTDLIGATEPFGSKSEEGLHPRLQAVIQAGRYYGMELDPADFRNVGQVVPTSSSLVAWIRESGMWSRAVRLRWRHLQRLRDTGPIVLLFVDDGAGLLTGSSAGHKLVFIKDPLAPAACLRRRTGRDIFSWAGIQTSPEPEPPTPGLQL